MERHLLLAENQTLVNGNDIDCRRPPPKGSTHEPILILMVIDDVDHNSYKAWNGSVTTPEMVVPKAEGPEEEIAEGGPAEAGGRQAAASETRPRKKQRREDIEKELEQQQEEEVDEDDGETGFIVEDILGHKGDKYLVKWLGYGHDENTWEPEEHVQGDPAFQRYQNKLAMPGSEMFAKRNGGKERKGPKKKEATKSPRPQRVGDPRDWTLHAQTINLGSRLSARNDAGGERPDIGRCFALLFPLHSVICDVICDL